MENLAILNVGEGDTKIIFDKNNPQELERAKRIITDMLKRGYAILVQAGMKNGKPVFYRATEFDPETCEYIVDGMPESEAFNAEVRDPDLVKEESLITAPPNDENKESGKAQPKPSWSRGRKKQRLPADTTKAVAVSRSAGGMSQAANSIEAENQRQLENMRSFDPFHRNRNIIAQMAVATDNWAGIPMPMPGNRLIIEPKWPRAKELMEFDSKEVQKDEEVAPLPHKLRNHFFSHARRGEVYIWELDGKIDHTIEYHIHGLRFQVMTIGASNAWGIEQEARAIQLLAGLLPHHTFKQYLLTGMFLERSQRSGLLYIFRKLRPTVAINDRDGQKSPKIIGALCMHPIAYYEDSWAGAMCPTDDVIAHLMLMRGDEKMFWKRSNQHSAARPEAGL